MTYNEAIDFLKNFIDLCQKMGVGIKNLEEKGSCEQSCARLFRESFSVLKSKLIIVVDKGELLGGFLDLVLKPTQKYDAVELITFGNSRSYP